MSDPRFTVLPLAALMGGAGWAADDIQEVVGALRLETHGFVSFGHLRTWENDHLVDDSREGTSEFHEAALNVIARPWDRVRLGAQLFRRDLGRYDNGRVELDWAYVDLQLHQLCVAQLGRVKIPLGLYAEIQDVDAARTPVFLPQSIYPTRLRELTIAVDGGKLSGRLAMGAAGALDYTVYAGTKNFADDGAYATYVGETSRMAVSDVDVGPVYGGMLHWDTPLPDLGARVSFSQARDIHVAGTSSLGATDFVSDSRSVIVALEWQPDDWTIAAEYLRISTDGESTAGATVRPYEFDYDGGYLSATWHAATWLECYAAAEYRRSQVLGRGSMSGWSWVGALNLMPLPHWSLKAEYQFQDNAVALLASDNPQGIRPYWHLVAVKTTVDF